MEILGYVNMSVNKKWSVQTHKRDNANWKYILPRHLVPPRVNNWKEGNANNSNRLVQQQLKKCSITVCIHSGITISLCIASRLLRRQSWSRDCRERWQCSSRTRSRGYVAAFHVIAPETPDYTTSGRAHRQRADKECIINDLNCLWTANAHKNILIIAICKIVPYESRSNKSQPKQAQPREAHSMWILWQKQVETAVRVRPKGKRTD